tara:strand:+ start:373 stop:579 length:207 start_codon:yes stop_codon:yes gene_type:complete
MKKYKELLTYGEVGRASLNGEKVERYCPSVKRWERFKGNINPEDKGKIVGIIRYRSVVVGDRELYKIY